MQCTNKLKQLGVAVQNYHDVYGHFPNEYGAVMEQQLFVSLLPYVEQQNLWAAIHAGQKATAVPTFLCPDRARYGSKVARTDYASARQDSFPIGIYSVLGGALTGQPFDGTDLKTVTNADGSANTFLLGHKELHPGRYKGGDPHDPGWTVLWTHSNEPVSYDHQRNAAGQNLPSHPYPDHKANQDGVNFGSSHPGATLYLYADGSVRNFSYTQTGKAGDGTPLGTAALHQRLWSYNDGVALHYE